jgi:hypothetical protein
MLWLTHNIIGGGMFMFKKVQLFRMIPILLVVFWVASLLILQPLPARAALPSLSIELETPIIAGYLGGFDSNSEYWNLETQSAGIGHKEVLGVHYYGNLKYNEQDGTSPGFTDLGEMPKPAGQQTISVTPISAMYQNDIKAQAGHLYLMKTNNIGYYALYVDDIQVRSDGYTYVSTTLYKLTKIPAAISSEPTKVPAATNGTTTITLSDGAVYTGAISNGVPSGLGKKVWPDGAEYDGYFKDGQKDGVGGYVWTSGDTYCGEWKDKKNGEGHYIWSNGAEFLGEFKNGSMDGEGIMIETDGSTKVGLWKADKLALTLISFSQPPEVINGRTFVPLRELFETLGAQVDWHNDTQTVVASKGGNNVELQIGSLQGVFRGETKQLDAAPFIENGRTFVPLRFASEALGEQVAYDDATNRVTFGNHYFNIPENDSSSSNLASESSYHQTNWGKWLDQHTNSSSSSSSSSSKPSNGEDYKKAFWNRFQNRNLVDSYTFNSRPWTSVRKYLSF